MPPSGQDFAALHYAPRAAAYLESIVHRTGQDLDDIEAWLGRRRPRQVLDLGCGGGHVTYRAALHASDVVACDVTPDMLDIVATEAAARGLTNVTVAHGAAERLPFETGRFDAVLSRFSAHHWTDLGAGLREIARVLAPGGEALLIDTIAPDDAVLDTHLQAIELLRDASHVRNYTRAQWAAALAHAGMDLTGLQQHRLPLDFEAWARRTATPEAHSHAIRSLQTRAPAYVRDHFEVTPDGSFTLEVLTLEAKVTRAWGRLPPAGLGAAPQPSPARSR